MFHLRVLPTKQHIESYIQKRHLHIDVTPERAIETLEFLRSASVIFRELEAHFKKYDLSLLRFLILVVLDSQASDDAHECHKLTFSDIHYEFDVSKAVMSRTLKALVEQRFVTVLEGKDDKRLKFFQITKSGVKILEETFPCYLSLLKNFEKKHFHDDR